jgi:formylglycine-generating enzyme required for sulfatase activity
VAPFHLAKYPVTDQQFQAFLDDPEGFSSPTWWEGLAADQEHISSPGEQRFDGGNHPRENVSWYDAVAFCRWMTEKVLGNEDNVGVPEQIVNKIRDEGWEIRLPTEWEWQMAATGGQTDRKFPWGMDWDDDRANTKHNQLNKTTAVGMYPSGVSPVGAYDLSGNVWEWCLNAYSDPEDLDLSREDRRVLRGGSWYHWGSYATTEMRSRYYPDYRYNAGGFRVICGPPLD